MDATFLSDDDFRARLLAELDADLDADEMREIEWAWQALGFIEPGVSLEAVLRQALGDGVLGFYDPESDELVMRGVVIDDFLRSTLVHELTHALDDQHFDLDRPSLMDGEDSEAQFGFTGLVEGTAVYVEELWVSGLDTDRLLQLRQAEAAFGADIDYSGLPEALLIDLSLPYIIGPSFVNELVAEGGLDRIDAAYLEPPVTGEQLFDADAYLTGDTAVDVDLPPSDGDVLTDGVIGASGFYELFLLFSPSDATVISEWDGDRFVVWAGDGDEVCLRVDVAAEGDDGRAAFESALESYASLSGAGEVENAGDLLRLTVCR